MICAATALDAVFVAVAFGLRSWLQWRRTGDAGWRLGRTHSRIEMTARALMFMAAALLVASLVGESWRTSPVVFAAGAAAAIAAIVPVAVAQLQMGASWRIGVDPDERTELVTAGIYAHVRHPIYTGMTAFTVAQGLMLPSPWTLAAVAAMTVGAELQARAVEEPYLGATHGPRFATWARTAGRFVPRLGRLS
ncbi:MAG: isoprenylcysteine carboxylmethyltransferase family protein [Ilumatobacteraceae bacterium]